MVELYDGDAAALLVSVAEGVLLLVSAAEGVPAGVDETRGTQQPGSPHEPYPQQPDTRLGDPQSQNVPPTLGQVPQPDASHAALAHTGTLQAPHSPL
jgi:hypothetical protein